MASQKRVDEIIAFLPFIKVDVENGNVYGLSGKEIKSKCLNGYLRFTKVWANRKKAHYHLHEIIAVAAGLDIVDNTVNHINGVKTNNRIANLEVVSLQENTRLQWATGLAYRKIKISEHPRILLLVEQGHTQTAVAKMYSVRQTTISTIVNDKHHHSH